MKSSYGAVLTDFFFAWGRFNRKWGRFGLGPFWTGAVLTGNLVTCRWRDPPFPTAAT